MADEGEREDQTEVAVDESPVTDAGGEEAVPATPQLGDDGGPAAAGDTDWKTRAEAAEAANEKLQGDSRSQKLQNLSQRERDLAYQEQGEKIDLLLSSFKDQGYTGIEDGLTELETKRFEAASTQEFQTEVARIQEAVGKIEVELGVSVARDPEFVNARRFWDVAGRLGTVSDLKEALHEAERARGNILSGKAQTAKTDIAKAVAAAKAQVREELGVHDLDSGSGGGGSGADWRDRTDSQTKFLTASEKDWAAVKS